MNKGPFNLVAPDANWLMVLSSIQKHWPEAIIAGGCLRDHQFGVQVKDVDIFIHGENEDSESVRQKLEFFIGGAPVRFDEKIEICNNPIYPNSTGNIFICELWGDKYQIVQRNAPFNPASLLDTFDLGFCQISWDGQEYFFTDAFAADVAKKRIRVIQEHPNTKKRVARFVEKYPTWEQSFAWDWEKPDAA